MEKLLSLLKSIPEYSTLLNCVTHRESAAITGIGQMNRSHMIAALRADTSAPIVILCQDFEISDENIATATATTNTNGM